MGFNNDDMKRLKELIDPDYRETVDFLRLKSKALIHRLECAEKLLDLWERLNDDCAKDFDNAFEAWQVSKGDGGKHDE